ncbi:MULTISPECIES: FAD-dependent monooxygenase [unclassified Streptomyces]|uniref:FAD-dependent monooxygenase n=1 Tax=Streptomyces sp. 2112.3 TaxID=1881023 RepID=UPI0015A731AD
MSVEVIVAGGGPVGLLTAALLDAAGITVEVLERRTGRSEQARATTMHPRTLEVLTLLRTEDDRRLSDILVSLGRPEPKAHFAVLPDLLDYAQLDTPYPFVLMVPQTTTERVLAAHLRRRGIAVHYGHDVSGFAQDADGVEVTVNGGVRRAGYLVGADGAQPRTTARGHRLPGDPALHGGLRRRHHPDRPSGRGGALLGSPARSAQLPPLPRGCLRPLRRQCVPRVRHRSRGHPTHLRRGTRTPGALPDPRRTARHPAPDDRQRPRSPRRVPRCAT